MKSIKKYNEIEELKNNNKLDKYNFANFFNVVEIGEKSYFNINKSLQFINTNNIPQQYYLWYEVEELDTWTKISYKFYNTVKLWWLICKINNIVNPFSELIMGTKIKILTVEMAENILIQIQNSK